MHCNGRHWSQDPDTVVDAKLLEGRAWFSLSKSNATWRGVDGRILPIVGEVPLTISFKDSVVDIKPAKVISNAVYPLILGVGWISASEASIIIKQGIMEVSVPKANPIATALPMDPVRCPVKDLQAGGYVQAISSEDEGSGGDAMEKSSKIPEDLEGKKEKLPTIIEEPDIHPELACLCAVVKDGIVQREKPVTLKPKRSPRIPAFSKGFVPAAVPEKGVGLWFLSTVGSTSLGREWVSPNCILREQNNGLVYVPILNLGRRPISWNRFRRKWKVEPAPVEKILTRCRRI